MLYYTSKAFVEHSYELWAYCKHKEVKRAINVILGYSNSWYSRFIQTKYKIHLTDRSNKILHTDFVLCTGVRVGAETFEENYIERVCLLAADCITPKHWPRRNKTKRYPMYSAEISALRHKYAACMQKVVRGVPWARELTAWERNYSLISEAHYMLAVLDVGDYLFSPQTKLEMKGEYRASRARERDEKAKALVQTGVQEQSSERNA